MTRLTAKDRPGREVQVVISRVVAKNQGHLEQAQVMIAAVAAAGKLGHTKVLVTKISFDSPGLNRIGIGNLNFRTSLTTGLIIE